jgi:uroporphyrinogen-III synthase
LNGKMIAILESRYGEELAALVRRRGAFAMHAPALAETPDLDPAALARLVAALERDAPRAFVFQTGVGTHALFDATDRVGLTPRLLSILEKTQIAVRGPKPAGPLRARGVRIDRNAKAPCTTAEVLDAMRDLVLDGGTVVVQRYGSANAELDRALEARGARVIEVPLYRWSLPADTRPLVELMDALVLGRVDAVAFTNAVQVRNLMTLAEALGRGRAVEAGLGTTLVASIGPVCTKALEEYGIKAGVEAHPPKLGPFVQALEDALKPEEEQDA